MAKRKNPRHFLKQLVKVAQEKARNGEYLQSKRYRENKP